MKYQQHASIISSQNIHTLIIPKFEKTGSEMGPIFDMTWIHSMRFLKEKSTWDPHKSWGLG